jgi:hypothetical protein
MSSSFKYLDKSNPSTSFGSQKAQEFLDEKLSKNRFSQNQQETLDANGGPTVANDSEGFLAKAKADADVTSTPEITVTGGGTERYADYDNTNGGETQFSDAWVDGAKYQQLRGTGTRSNEAFNQQFETAKGGAETGTIADDGGGWKLIKQDPGPKTNERKLEYKDFAAQWQAAGYDVRAQDHNPDFEGGTGEIAVRIGQPKAQATKEEKEPIEHSPEIKQAKERVRAYEDDVLSGKVSDDVYAGNTSDKYNLDLNKGADGIGAFIPNTSEQATASFLDNKKSQIKDKYQFNRA